MVNGKIGNMRKSQEWVVYPLNSSDQSTRVIQCDNRIAQVNLTTGKVLLSDGKGGHQGFIKLNPSLGAKEFDCPQEILEQLRAKSAPVGSVTLEVKVQKRISKEFRRDGQCKEDISRLIAG